MTTVCIIDRYEVKGCQIIWAIKDHAISHTFFDEGAAAFFLPHLTTSVEREKSLQCDTPEFVEVSPFKRTKYGLDQSSGGGHTFKGQTTPDCDRGAEVMGVALGPDWHAELKMTGKETTSVSD